MEGTKRAVLNIIPDKDAWVNGVVIPFESQEDWKQYRSREEGYHLDEVDPATIETYDKSDVSSVDQFSMIKIPVGHRISKDITLQRT